jgi:hypothetical protein
MGEAACKKVTITRRPEDLQFLAGLSLIPDRIEGSVRLMSTRYREIAKNSAPKYETSFGARNTSQEVP